MAKFNKEFEYKDYKFNTSIELNTKIEKRLNGKRFHTIITNCLGGNNYYQKDEIETFQIEEYVEKHKKSAIDYIDKLTYKPQSLEEQLLSGLGFS
jgi:hypothetical protein